MATAKWVRTPEQRANLRKLADWLKELKDPEVFGMQNYVSIQDNPCVFSYDHALNKMVSLVTEKEKILQEKSEPVEKVIHECGTVCCAIGMTPFAFPKEAKEFVSDNPITSDSYWDGWHNFSEGLFGVLDVAYWGWMFESFWAEIDDTPEGAAARIEYFASAKRPPKFYSFEQLRMRAPKFVEKYQMWRDERVDSSHQQAMEE